VHTPVPTAETLALSRLAGINLDTDEAGVIPPGIEVRIGLIESAFERSRGAIGTKGQGSKRVCLLGAARPPSDPSPRVLVNWRLGLR
jgi:hypothetical protein